MKKAPVIIFIYILCIQAIAQPPVHLFPGTTTDVTADALPNHSALATSNAKSGQFIQTIGFYTPGDGGAATYYIEPPGYSGYIDTIHTVPMSSGSFAVFQGNPINFKQYGFKADVVENISVSISGNTVTCLSCSFAAADQDKAIYIERSFDVGGKLEAHPRFDATSYPTFASTPSSYAGDTIVKVTNSADYNTRDTLTGEHYFIYNSSHGWTAMLHLVDAVYNIDQVLSPTQIQINYTAPAALSNLTAHYGTNNKYRWDKIKELVNNTGISTNIDPGHYAIEYDMGTSDGATFYYDDGQSSQGERAFNMSGSGSESTLHFWYTSDTLGFVTDPSLPDNTFLGGFFNYSDPRSQADYDICNFNLRDFNFKGIQYTGFRNVDGRNRGAFMFGTGKGKINVQNVNGSGGDGFAYHSGQWDAEYQNITYDGLKSAEVGFQNFGEVSIKVDKFLIENVGPFHYYTVFSSNGRGRPMYTHPERSIWLSNGIFRNNTGVNHQLFSGGGVDSKDTTAIEQNFSNLKFEWTDDSGFEALGVYSGRVGERLDIDKTTFNASGLPKGQAGKTAILLNGEATISDANFNNIKAFAIGESVGTNNVRLDGDSIATINFNNAAFKESSIDISSLAEPAPEFRINVDNFSLLVDSLAIGSNWIRITSADAGTQRLTTAKFSNGIIQGYLNNEVGTGLPNETPLIFIESTQPKAHVIFDNVKFRLKTFGTGDNQFLIKQLRSDVTIEFNYCDAPPGDTIYIDTDASTPEPVILGKENDFRFIQMNDNGGYPHQMKLRRSVGDTLASATTVTIEGIHHNEYYISGSTQIETIRFGINGTAQRLVNDRYYLIFVDGLTIGTAGNFDLASPRVIPAGARVLIDYSSSTIQNTILEVNEP